MNGPVAVLGAGAVGSAVAARAAATGRRVICVCTSDSAAQIREHGLEVETATGVLRARPEVVELLETSVSLLVVAVKAPALADALERIEVFAAADGVVLPLLNGLEHPDVIRRRLAGRVAPGTIARFSAEALAPGRVVERSGTPLVTAAPGDVTRQSLESAVEPLVQGGIDVRLADDERGVLWEKTARLAVLAAATTASALTVGELRSDPSWRARLEAAVAEACAVASVEGVALRPVDQWAMIDAMPADASTSTAFDAARGRATELDAIAGSVLRAARRAGLPCPALSGLVSEAQRTT